MWRAHPPRPHSTHLPHLAAILVLVLCANIIANEVLSPPSYVPFNLAVLAVATLIARSAGTTWTSMGIRSDRIWRGAAVGSVIAVAVIAAMAALALVPATREAFEDDRIIEGSIELSLYHALLRVPLGTALYEEILFRGILFGMLARRYTPLAAALASSLLFGLWHVLPAIDAIQTNPIGEALGGTFLPIVGAVASTVVAGFGFVWIRLRGGSIIAPIIVHGAIDSSAILAATLVVHVL